ncbi:hypothetical protein [Malacoplasma iowae]|uniref:Uncharacterized protein n=2 Tax=Malacoplasma iowae TaxID=2116 RepID=A0A084U3B7_MALIO|nr:hypothetical protein [Malacoplasma iowae]VEU62778.1 Uncharacterised protein [Mycoplasmopsis fermentans]EGZ31456.1 hypothetical protein GUU_01937 [Malacoplasma iowae 695]KFB07453.1 hypothetical protein P271_289 [Malacoplasma iowae DK-CPA]QHG89390.1 hypothetical protein EER00_00540 [Malacoplasma iowae 695]WPL35897.1 hypothetical protein QX180_00540 [Malacoplasma iowae]
MINAIIKKTNTEFVNKKNITNFYTDERYYYLVNNFIDKQLKQNSKLTFFVISYMFRSNNYKHYTSSINSKSIWIWIVDIFCWLCMIGFFICLITGIATPIVTAIKTVDINKIITTPLAIGLLVITIICFLVSSFYIYIMTKIVSKNKTLSIQDFVIKKINYLLKFSFVSDIKSTLKINEKQQEAIILDNIDKLDAKTKWNLLWIQNTLYSIFKNYNIYLKFSNISESEFEELSLIIKNDFNNLTIEILE